MHACIYAWMSVMICSVLLYGMHTCIYTNIHTPHKYLERCWCSKLVHFCARPVTPSEPVYVCVCVVCVYVCICMYLWIKAAMTPAAPDTMRAWMCMYVFISKNIPARACIMKVLHAYTRVCMYLYMHILRIVSTQSDYPVCMYVCMYACIQHR